MNINMKTRSNSSGFQNALILFLLLVLLLLPILCNATKPITKIDKYNVVWDSPSNDSFGSMPLGNGEIGLNAWVEKNGDLLFYISKVDAFDASHLLPKLGRVRIKMVPALQVEKFKQTLHLIDASVLIEAGDVKLRIWVDANEPVIMIECKSQTPRTTTIMVESLRLLVTANDPLPNKGTIGVLFNDNENRLVWCYRNQSSAWAVNFKNQNTPEMVSKTKDPILYRTSGCLLQAKGFKRENNTTLRQTKKSKTFDCSVKVISTQPKTLQAWLSEISKPFKSDWEAHCTFWKSFWNRSYINIISGGKGKFNLDQCRFTQFAQGSKAYEGHKEIDAEQNIAQISQRYAFERFCEAAVCRGNVPSPYNGSILTMDMPVGAMGSSGPKSKPV